MDRRRLRRYLFWGFALSILLHLIGGPLLGRIHYAEQEQPEVQKVSISKMTLSTPTPPPTPPPTPKPTPKPTPTPQPTRPPTPTPPPQTPPPTPPPTQPPPKLPPPPPRKSTPPPQPHLKLNVPKAVSTAAHAPSEQSYVSAPGTENGVPGGHGAAPAPAGNGLPGSGNGTGQAPQPACAQPHVEAATKNAVQPDYPEVAREQGAQGVAKVKVSLDAHGSVLSVAILQSTGNAALDQEALKAAKESTYAPEVVNCQPVGGDYVFTADFQSE